MIWFGPWQTPRHSTFPARRGVRNLLAAFGPASSWYSAKG